MTREVFMAYAFRGRSQIEDGVHKSWFGFPVVIGPVTSTWDRIDFQLGDVMIKMGRRIIMLPAPPGRGTSIEAIKKLK